jgi:hypothetical protein
MYNDQQLEEQANKLDISDGDKVKLYQDGDFEVEAILNLRYVDILNKVTWVAAPDWSTIVRFA